jgi:glucokinase
MAEHWLLADLGGTNTRVGLARDGHLRADSIQNYANAQFESPAQLFQHYLSEQHCPKVAALCAGVAGPVRHGRAQLTNHHWVIEGEALSQSLGVGQITLMNDLQAQGFALDDLATEHVITLFAGARPEPHDVRMVMGLGTGSNIAVVHDTSTGLYVPASEAGHISLPYGDGEQADLVAHLGTLQAHRPMESALSGTGLGNIYHWLTGHRLPPEGILHAYHQGSADATKAIMLFCQLLGQMAGDL